MTSLSLVVPAHNEEQSITVLLHSIRNNDHATYPIETIVVDNGSNDATRRVARSFGARVIEQSTGSIGSLRNSAAYLATGDILIFLDADMELTIQWWHRLPFVVDKLTSQPQLITGSRPYTSIDGSWLERYWFARKEKVSGYVRYLGAAHLIMTKSWFMRIGGFDESKSTGEDYDLCIRATLAGGTVVNDPNLVAIHHGFPSTIRAFVRREAWHGVGDWSNWRSFRQSKVAWATLLFGFLHVALFAVFLPYPYSIVSAMAPIFLLSLIGTSAIVRFRHYGFKFILINTIVH